MNPREVVEDSGSRPYFGLLPELCWGRSESVSIGCGARRMLLFGLKHCGTINRNRHGCALKSDELRGAAAGF